MEVTNFYTPNSSMKFRMIDISMRHIKERAKKSEDEVKFQDRDAPIGIWNWAKSNQEYKLLLSKLGVSQTDNEQILINLMEENIDYHSNNTARLYSYPDQKDSILFKESQIFEIYILKEVRRWTVKSIAAKYGIDSHTVIEWDRQARK